MKRFGTGGPGRGLRLAAGLASLASLLLTVVSVLPAHAGDMIVRSEVRVDPAIDQALAEGSSRLPVLIVARQAGFAMAPGERNPVQLRRMLADESTAEIFSILAAGGPPEGAEAPVPSQPEVSPSGGNPGARSGGSSTLLPPLPELRSPHSSRPRKGLLGSLDRLTHPQGEAAMVGVPTAPSTSIPAPKPLVGSAPRVTYLWAANAVATEVDRSTLGVLRKTGSVARLVLDRELQALDAAPEYREGAEVPGVTLENAESYGIVLTRARELRDQQGLTGKGVRVGVIDSGIDPDHPALKGRLRAFKDFVKHHPEAFDDLGHGTHCAATLAGSGDIGVAPGVELIVAKALNHQGRGRISCFLEAMQWMLDPDGDPLTDDQPRVVSNSWGVPAELMREGREVFRELILAWRQAGILPLFASGNFGPDVQVVPGGYPEVLAVGATDASDQVWEASSGGDGEYDGETCRKPDLTAPGVAILSARNGGGYSYRNGTSMACPHVAGAVALLLEAFPGTGVDQLEAALLHSAKDLGEPGRDTRYGVGRLDVKAALEELTSPRNR